MDDHRRLGVRLRPHVPAEPRWSAAPSCPTRTWASSWSTSTRRRARRSRARPRSPRSIVKEIGEQEGVSHVSYLAGADRYTHFHVFFYLLPIDERTVTQDQVIARVRRILAKHPGANPTVVARNPLVGRRWRRRRVVHQRVAARARHRQAVRLLAAASSRRRKQHAEPGRRADRLQQRQPGGAGGGRSRARRRPRRADGDGRQHAAPDGGRRRRDFELPRGGRAVSGEDPRAGKPAARHRHGRQADGRVDRPAARCASTTSPA